jgi:hypothetical protein
LQVGHDIHVAVLARLANRRPPLAATLVLLAVNPGVDVGALLDEQLHDAQIPCSAAFISGFSSPSTARFTSAPRSISICTWSSRPFAAAWISGLPSPSTMPFGSAP